MSKQVLIVSPHFPPINAADHQRIRMALPHLPKFGWTPTVLAAAPEFVEAPRDEWLLRTLPDDVPIHRVSALPVELTRRFGLSTIAFRCRRSMRLKGDELLASGQFQLVYFSTTQVGVHRLGIRWKRRFGVPFILDLQDPWVNTFYRDNSKIRPPGGRLKFALSQWVARHDEPRCLSMASAITTVSPRYVEDIVTRSPGITRNKFHVLPFGASPQDFEIARRFPVSQAHIDFDDGLEHWVAVGRGGQDMHTALTGLFRGFRRALDVDSRFRRVRMHFLGTDYAAGSRARESVRPLAASEGLSDYVFERPHRIPYSEALQCILRSDLLLVIGSDDRAYNPSKVAPYLMSGRPVLAILHSDSPAASLVRHTGGNLTCFSDATGLSAETVCSLLRSLPNECEIDATLLNELSAETMTARLAGVFDLA